MNNKGRNHSHNIADIRKLLASAFDDVTLISLCQDEFPDLAKNLARGLRKDEIINYIIDYFDRFGDFGPLLSAIKDREPIHYAIYEGFVRRTLHEKASVEQPGSVREDWAEALDVPIFYGREVELGELERWVGVERCRLISILGIGGIGKSSLAVKLIELIKEGFEFLFWRDLRNGPSLNNVLDDCIKFLSDQQNIHIPSETNTKIAILIDQLKAHRCLLVLDNMETILQGGEAVGSYRSGFEDYEQFTRRVGNSAHQSVLIITSREKPREVALMESARARVKSLYLTGLDVNAAQKLVHDKKVIGSTRELNNLIELYARNPLALNLATAAILDWFDGRIEDFLVDDLAVFGEIEDLIEQQLRRLPETGQEIMYWLAIQREIVSMGRLEREIMYWFVIWRDSVPDNIFGDLVRPITKEELLETLESLRRRSLLEKVNSHFTLQPVVMDYLTKQFVKQIYVEIATERPVLLRSHALIQAQAKDYVRQSQVRFILKPLGDRLRANFNKEIIEGKLLSLLSSIQNPTRILPGYLGGNVVNCLVEMDSDFTGRDFSNLAIWQANLKAIELHDVNFSNSDLSRSVFAETFDLILSVAFSPDGELVAAGSASGDIIIWRVSENRQILVLSGHTGWARCVAFSPNSQLIASGSGDRTVRLWDVETGQLVHTLAGHGDWVRSVAFSPDGNILASAGSDRSIRLWNVDTGQPIRMLEKHTDWVWSLHFSPDGSKLASGSNDKSICIWDVNSGELLGELKGHSDWVTSVAFSGDGQLIASGSNDRTIRIWNVNTQSVLNTFEGHTDRVWSVAFSFDNSVLVSGSYDRTIRVWDVKTGQKLKTLQGHKGMVISVAYSPDGNLVASGSEDQTVRLWNVKTGECIRTFQGHTNGIQSIAFHPDNRHIVSGSTDWSVRLWDIETLDCLRTYHGHSNRVQSVAISKDGETIASCGDDQTVRLWSTDLSRPTKILSEHSSWIRSVVFSPDEQLLASACDDLTVRIWNPYTGQCIKILEGYSSWVATLCFSPDGRSLATGGADSAIKLWDVETATITSAFIGHSLRVNSIAFSQSGHFLVSGSDDHTVILWDVETGSILRKFEGHNGPVKSVVFDHTGKTIASAGDDQTIRLWDVDSVEPIRIMSGHSRRVWAVAFDSTGELIASGSDDGTIRVWSVDSGSCIKTLRNKRIYEGLNITGVRGLTDVQRMNLIALGAIDNSQPQTNV